MSYGPPPTKTPYGDQDFIKEDVPAGGPPSGSPFAPRASGSPYASQYPLGQMNNPYPQATPTPAPTTPLHQAPYSQQAPPYAGGGGQQDIKQLASTTFNLTPEDQIFMNSWRRDSFYQRVLPLTLMGNGIYYYYNYSKQLPHKPIHYFLVTSSAYIIGKWSFKEELKRRVEASPSQTPFMQGLRTLVGLQTGPVTSGGEFAGDMSQEFMGGGFGSANVLPPPTVNSAYTRPGPGTAGSGPYAGQPYSQGMLDSQPFQPNETFNAQPNDGAPPLPTTSYEELRARNRGLIR